MLTTSLLPLEPLQYAGQPRELRSGFVQRCELFPWKCIWLDRVLINSNPRYGQAISPSGKLVSGSADGIVAKPFR